MGQDHVMVQFNHNMSGSENGGIDDEPTWTEKTE